MCWLASFILILFALTTTSLTSSADAADSLPANYSTALFARDCVVNASAPLLALTFNGSPSRRTPELLDVLKTHGVVATFFVSNSELYDDFSSQVLQRLIRDGHMIANGATPFSSSAITECQQRIRGLTGLETRYARPERLDGNEQQTAMDVDHRIAMWNIDARSNSSRNVLNRMETALANPTAPTPDGLPRRGSFIVAMQSHDDAVALFQNSKGNTLMQRVIELVRAAHYEFVRLDACLGDAKAYNSVSNVSLSSSSPLSTISIISIVFASFFVLVLCAVLSVRCLRRRRQRRLERHWLRQRQSQPQPHQQQSVHHGSMDQAHPFLSLNSNVQYYTQRSISGAASAAKTKTKTKTPSAEDPPRISLQNRADLERRQQMWARMAERQSQPKPHRENTDTDKRQQQQQQKADAQRRAKVSRSKQRLHWPKPQWELTNSSLIRESEKNSSDRQRRRQRLEEFAADVHEIEDVEHGPERSLSMLPFSQVYYHTPKFSERGSVNADEIDSIRPVSVKSLSSLDSRTNSVSTVAPLPKYWSQHFDENDEVYYWNSKTCTSQWNRPSTFD